MVGLEGIRVAVIGGSIAGLSAACAFHRLGALVSVYEKNPSGFSGRGSSMGFCDVNLWQRLRGSTMLRRGVQASRSQGAFLYGDLWSFWSAGLPPNTVRYGVEVSDLGDDPNRPTVLGEVYDLVIVADGGWSTLRAKYFDQAIPRYAGYTGYRFRVASDRVPGWNSEGMYSSSLGGPYDSILMRIAKDDGTDWIMGGTTFATPESALDKPTTGSNRQDGGGAVAGTPEWFLPWFRDHFGSYAGGELVRAMAAAEISSLPQYEFASSRVVLGRLVLIGDAAHMASPRTAAGAHTAVLDSAALFEAFAGSAQVGGGKDKVIDRAIAAYDQPALRRAAQLYARSIEVSANVAVQGWSPSKAKGEL